jgi:hypothetical protein
VATATKLAASGSDDASVGSLTWGNPGAITADDTTYAQQGWPDQTGGQTHYLKAYFSFTSADVPNGATINGITARIRRWQSRAGTGIGDTVVKLVKAGVVQATNRSAGAGLPTSEQTAVFGGATDLWGTTWTAADIQNAQFGVVYSCTIGAPGEYEDAGQVSCDWIEISVDYTATPTTVNGAKLAATAAGKPATLTTSVVIGAGKLAASAGAPASNVLRGLVVTGARLAATAGSPSAAMATGVIANGAVMGGTAAAPPSDLLPGLPPTVVPAEPIAASANAQSVIVIAGQLVVVAQLAASGQMAAAEFDYPVTVALDQLSASANGPSGNALTGQLILAAVLPATAGGPSGSVLTGQLVALGLLAASAQMRTAAITYPVTVALARLAASGDVVEAFAFAAPAVIHQPARRIRVDVFDAAGSQLGNGAIASALACSYSLALDAIGSFSLDFPATDAKAAALQVGQELRVFREDEGLVFRGLVDTIETAVSGEERVLRVRGSSLARQLVWANTLLARAFQGTTLASAVATLLAGSGWTAGTLDTPATTLLARFDGATVWAALLKVAEIFALHVREDPLNRQVDVGAFGTSAGLVFQNVPAVHPRLAENPALFPVTDLQVTAEGAEVWNRVILLGGGEGINQLTLRHATRSSPYPVLSAAGPDGQLYWYIEDSASVAAYGPRVRVLVVKEAVPLANSPAGLTAAANALYDEGVTWLLRHKDPPTTYAVSVAGLRHVTAGAPVFEVGQKARLVYHGAVQDQDGTMRAFRTVDALVWLLGFSRTFKDDGRDEWQLSVSTVDRQPEDAGAKVVAALADLQALKVTVRPFTYREIHGPERRSVDPTHSVTFVVDYDANVTYLHQALLSVAVKPVRTNASGAASGGGSVATSGGGSAHSHTVSGQSASDGGGQTSSAESAHTHTVSGQTASAPARIATRCSRPSAAATSRR